MTREMISNLLWQWVKNCKGWDRPRHLRDCYLKKINNLEMTIWIDMEQEDSDLHMNLITVEVRSPVCDEYGPIAWVLEIEEVFLLPGEIFQRVHNRAYGHISSFRLIHSDEAMF